jgi:hypothetical protein
MKKEANIVTGINNDKFKQSAVHQISQRRGIPAHVTARDWVWQQWEVLRINLTVHN